MRESNKIRVGVLNSAHKIRESNKLGLALSYLIRERVIKLGLAYTKYTM